MEDADAQMYEASWNELMEDADAQMYEASWNELFNLQAEWADGTKATTTGASASTGTSRP